MSDEPRQDESPPPEGSEAEDARDTAGAFEEALDAAEVFSELADEGAHPAAGADDTAVDEGTSPEEAAGFEEAAFADDFDLAARPGAETERLLAEALDEDVAEPGPAMAVLAGDAVPTADTEPIPVGGAFAVMAGDARHSIGMLFKPVVRHSPPSKIRVEADSVGALFRRFIEQDTGQDPEPAHDRAGDRVSI